MSDSSFWECRSFLINADAFVSIYTAVADKPGVPDIENAALQKSSQRKIIAKRLLF
jgi:hypothetical protein